MGPTCPPFSQGSSRSTLPLPTSGRGGQGTAFLWAYSAVVSSGWGRAEPQQAAPQLSGLASA